MNKRTETQNNNRAIQEVPSQLNAIENTQTISEQMQVYGGILFACFIILATVNFILKSTSNN